MNAQLQLSRMARQSADVIAHPSVRTFNYYGARASDSQALLYVTVAAVLIGLVGMVVARSFDVIGLAYGVVNQLFDFYIFAGVVYLVGRQFGGIGSFTAVAYTFALFYVPILLLAWVLTLALALLRFGSPLLPLAIDVLELAAQAYFAYLAVQAALYLRRPRDAALTVAIGLAVLWLIHLVFSGGILGG
jgi:hypothetical protein